ncbi:MAG: transporter substrate-binding domain-containing protein [Christensenella sp.]|nr:transporter substrate-binding domain-containing protein [Christensenella sp.]
MGKKLKKIVWIVLCALLICAPFCVAHASQTGGRQVKVGFYAIDGYQMIDEDGKKSGYAYEYLQHMKLYTDWEYEYVGYDSNLSDTLGMLENGEIDLLISTIKTPEREEIFGFSDRAISTSASNLLVKQGNMKYVSEDYGTYNGMRVGLIMDSAQVQNLADFAQEKGFTYQPVYYPNAQEVLNALQSGEVDAAALTNLIYSDGVSELARFSAKPVYVMVRKDDEELLSEVNFALKQIDVYEPGLEEMLYQKYYTEGRQNKTAFTQEEMDYIRECNQKGMVFQALLNPDRYPYSDFKDGEATGIIADLTAQILARTGLSVEIVDAGTRENYQKLIASGSYALILDAIYNYNNAESVGYTLTNPYYSASISRVTKKDHSEGYSKIAVISYSDIAQEYVPAVSPGAQVFYYDNVQECIDAVLSGTCDATYLYTRTAQNVIYRDSTNRLASAEMPLYTTNFSIGISDDEDILLKSIFNKAAMGISETDIANIETQYADYPVRNLTWLQYLYNNPEIGLVNMILIFVAILAITMLCVGRKHRRIEQNRLREYQKLLYYLCLTDTEVMEFDIDNKVWYRYTADSKDMHCVTLPYDDEKVKQRIFSGDRKRISDLFEDATILKICEGKESIYFEARYIEEGGEYRWYAYNVLGIREGANITKNVMVFRRDIQQAKMEEERQKAILIEALDAAKQASAAKGVFLSHMSHEIRTPLNVIIGYNTLGYNQINKALEEKEDCLEAAQKVKGNLENAIRASKYLMAVINNILDFSAIETGKMRLSVQLFDISDMLQSMEAMFRSIAEEKGVALHIETRGITDSYVAGDEVKLSQVLINILNNAIKFTPRGGSVTLTVSEEKRAEDTVYLRFCVKDTGRGISAEFLPHIFEPFRQQENVKAEGFPGSGLGMPITKNILALMNGVIRVESIEGKGTSVTMDIPFSRKYTRQSAGEYHFSHLRALVIDSDSVSSQGTRKMLGSYEVKSDAALSADVALEKIAESKTKGHEYDFCLINAKTHLVPLMEFLRSLRAVGDKNLFLILYQSKDAEEERQALASGVDMVVTKPLELQSILDILISVDLKNDAAQTEGNIREESLQDVRILAVEDNDFNREILVSLLEDAGYHVEEAVNGKQAAEMFAQSPPGTYQLILMDIQMPVMDGYQAARAIRSSAHPQAKDIPILAMTANAFKEDVAKSISAGMNYHISKPVEAKLLFELLKKYLQGE